MAAQGEKIASAYVEIAADLSKVDAGLNQLEPKVTQRVLGLQQSIQAQLARNRLEMKVATSAGGGGIPEINRLAAENARLEVQLQRVNQAALNQAAALRGVGVAARQTSTSYSGGGGAAGRFNASLHETQKASMRSTMGLMALSNAIQDSQFGFAAIVNNLGQAGGLFSADAEKAMKLGAAFQLMGVATQVWIKNWDDAKEIFGDLGIFDPAIEKLAEFRDMALSAAGSVSEFVLSGGEIRGVSITQADIDAKKQQQAIKAAREKRAGKAADELAGIGAEGDSERAAAFREAVEKFGGGDALRKALGEGIKASGGTAEAQKNRSDAVFDMVGRALKGDQAAIRSLTASPLGNERLGQFYSTVSPEAKANLKRIEEQRQQEEKLKGEAVELENRDREKAAQDRDREADRLARSLQAPVGKRMLNNEGANVQDDVRNRLRKAGVADADLNEMAYRVAKKIREAVDAEVTDRALGGGLTEEQARKQLLAEQIDKEEKAAEAKLKEERGPERQFSMTEGAQNIVRNMQMRAFQVLDPTPKQQLKEAKDANKHLADINKTLQEKKEPTARFRR